MDRKTQLLERGLELIHDVLTVKDINEELRLKLIDYRSEVEHEIENSESYGVQ